jgi:hypothetical protein
MQDKRTSWAEADKAKKFLPERFGGPHATDAKGATRGAIDPNHDALGGLGVKTPGENRSQYFGATRSEP